ncbi:MAG: aminoacyl-tRNA hydrolase [candidate division Zixibacteria bacterium]|nr:aminoacyl-tRNA hydrolase [candidate division Zixibacteria bacterium]
MISLILGLGNIGRQYNNTRHNVGFDVLYRVADILIRDKQVNTIQRQAEFYDILDVNETDHQFALAWPKTFMNRSGLAADKLLEEMSLLPEQMLVIVDDFNLPLGKLRLRYSGSDGGHNGLESIVQTIGTKNFPRLRLGIGPIPDTMNSVDFVLGKFNTEEKKYRKEMLDNAAEAVFLIINNCFEEAMNKYNADPA